MKEVSSKVKINSVKLIESLSSLFIMNFDIDDMYKSSYGTIVLEFLKDSSSFTIEIGENSFGYFSESHNKIDHIQEEVFLSSNENDNEIAFGQLNLDFIDFYNRHNAYT